ncbi:hypothetical protein ACFRCQ_07565 [Cytobacillus firmus]|uniref:hypothetical protein n=1 Tax=Cytobacillus firmus TaxID=1399 RepID=UPI00368E26B1
MIAPTCEISGFELLVKQLEYEVRTYREVLRLKEKGLKDSEVAERVGIRTSEVSTVTAKKFEKATKKLFSYKCGGLNYEK